MDALPIDEQSGLDFAADQRCDARLWARPAHDVPDRGRAPARTTPGPSPWRRRADVPARRGGLGRRRRDDQGGHPGRGRTTRRRGVRDARVLEHLPGLPVPQPARTPDGCLARALRHCAWARWPRLDAAPDARPDLGHGRDDHRPADDGHPPVRRVRPGRRDRREDRGRQPEEHHSRRGALRGHGAPLLRGQRHQAPPGDPRHAAWCRPGPRCRGGHRLRRRVPAHRQRRGRGRVRRRRRAGGARRGEVRRPPVPDHRLRGLLTRPGGCAGSIRVHRRDSSRPRPGDGAVEPQPPRRLRSRRAAGRGRALRRAGRAQAGVIGLVETLGLTSPAARPSRPGPWPFPRQGPRSPGSSSSATETSSAAWRRRASAATR